MTSKILFLDFDGVLNSTHWAGQRPIRGLLPPELAGQALEEERLDPVCVDRLQRLVRETGAHIMHDTSIHLAKDRAVYLQTRNESFSSEKMFWVMGCRDNPLCL